MNSAAKQSAVKLTDYFKGRTLKSAVWFFLGRGIHTLMLVFVGWVGSSEILGELESVHAVAVVAGSFGTLGFANLAVTLLPKYLELGEQGKSRGVIFGFWRFVSVSGVISGAAVCAALVYWQAFDLNTGLIVIPMIACYGLHRYHRAVSRSFGDVGLALAPEFVFWPLLTVLGILLAAVFKGFNFPQSVQPYLWSSLLGMALPLAVQGLILRDRLPSAIRVAPVEKLWGQWFRMGLVLVCVDGAYILITKTDILMLRWLVGAETAGIYALASGVATWVSFPLIIANTVGPKLFSECLSRSRMDELQALLSYIIVRVFISSLVLALGVVLFGGFILLQVGDEYYVAYLPMLILVIGYLIDVGCGSVGWLLQAADHIKASAIIYLVTCLLNFLLNLIFIPRWGLLGAAIATALSVAFRNIVQLVLVRRFLGIDSSLMSCLRPK